jgi:hypothetical protein
MSDFERSIESLAGQELSAVSFVRDYVEFHFDGPVLRALTNPRVELDRKSASFPEPGARDLLCMLIGRTVREVTASDGVHIRLTFEDGAVLTVPLDEESHVGPEGAHFQSHLTAPVQVWN